MQSFRLKTSLCAKLGWTIEILSTQNLLCSKFATACRRGVCTIQTLEQMFQEKNYSVKGFWGS